LERDTSQKARRSVGDHCGILANKVRANIFHAFSKNRASKQVCVSVVYGIFGQARSAIMHHV
jgi:hypothetical protein